MEFKNIHNDDFSSRLGVVRSSLFIRTEEAFQGRSENHARGTRSTFTTAGHFIEMYSFGLATDWLTDADMSVEGSRGWVWMITKINPLKERLKIETKLMEPAPDVVSEPQSGEFLDAVVIENENEQLTIGTEDNEIMQVRAAENDWMPERLNKTLKLWEPGQVLFTNYSKFGFDTQVPDLLENEKVYFHFLCAFNSRKKSIDYPGEDDISTWYAVDQPKKNILKWLGIKE
jgi:hypothetical protein